MPELQTDYDHFREVCMNKKYSLQDLKDLFPLAHPYFGIRAFPMVFSTNIFKTLLIMPAGNKRKFLKDEIVPQLTLSSEVMEKQGEWRVLELRSDWTQMHKLCGDHCNKQTCEFVPYMIEEMFKLSSVGHWYALDKNGLTFHQAAFQSKYNGETPSRWIFPQLSVFKLFDVMPYPTPDKVMAWHPEPEMWEALENERDDFDFSNQGIHRLSYLLEHSEYKSPETSYLAMFPDSVLDAVTDKKVKAYIKKYRFQYDVNDRYTFTARIFMRYVASNGLSHLFNEQDKVGYTPLMRFSYQRDVDHFNERYSAYYDYDIKDNGGMSALDHNLCDSTLRCMTAAQLKKYQKELKEFEEKSYDSDDLTPYSCD